MGSESCLVEEEKTPHQKKNERLCGSIWCDKKIILRPCLVLRVTVCVLCNKIEKNDTYVHDDYYHLSLSHKSQLLFT